MHPRCTVSVRSFVSKRLLLLVAAVPTLVATGVLVAQRSTGPALYADEMGYLGIGVAASTRDAAPWLGEIEFYSPGYGLLLAPLLSTLDSAPWVLAVAVNLLAVALIGPVLLALLQRLGTPRRLATAAALAGACTPSTLLQVGRAWPECVLALTFALWCLVLLRTLEDHQGLQGPLLALLASASFVLHRRSVVLLIVTGIVLAGLGVRELRRRRRPGAGQVAGLLVLASGVTASRWLDSAVMDRLYEGSELVDGTQRAGELAREDLVPRLVAGVWSLGHATLGLTVVAVAALALMVWHREHVAWATALVLTLGGGVALSVLVIADGPRVDHLLYERYVAPMAVVFVAVGVSEAARVAEVSWRRWVTAAVLPLATIATVVALGTTTLRGSVQKLTIPTLSTLSLVSGGAGRTFVHQIPLLPIAAVGGLALVGYLWLARRRPWEAGVVVAVAFACTAVAGAVWSLGPFVQFWDRYARPLSDAAALHLPDDGRIGRVAGAPEPSTIVLQYRLGYPPVVAVDDQRCPDVDVIVAATGFSPAYPIEVLARSEIPRAVLAAPRCG